jgi:NADPH:quinone reductase-like Zn-dependent oxidoreductase
MENKAVGINGAGGPEMVAVIDRETREPGPGEVLIRVRAAAISPTDVATVRGGLLGDLPTPWTPGMDAAGHVEAVGPGVERLAVGDAVMATCFPGRPEGGAQQNLLIVPEAGAVPIPEDSTLEEASTLPMNGLTAILALDMLDLPKGGTLAITGAAGLVGYLATAIAKERGLRVIAQAKPEDEDALRAAGAETIVPRSADFSAAVREVVPDGVDAVLDTALLHEDALGAIRDGGQIAVMRLWGGPTERDIEIQKVLVNERLEDTAGLEYLRKLVADGRVQLRVADTYPPERAAEAQERMLEGGIRGRLVLTF